MECNKDDAIKAREIAEKKFLAKDFTGALKFACKAENLYPSLDGISHMVASMNVYVNSETLVNGEKDWYAVLCVTTAADEETVKKQYRKLALMLHPDKNKSIGADGAFKLISEAWSVLSDKTRRMAYDQKRNLKVRHFSQPNGSSNGLYNFGRRAASSTSVRKNTAQSNPAPAAPQTTHPPNPGTFWTSCKHCNMQYEYLRCYLNHKLLCPNCHEPFLAVETAKSTNGTYSSAPWLPKHPQQTVNQNRASCGLGRTASTVSGKAHGELSNGTKHDTFTNKNFQCGAFSRTAGVASATASSTAAAQAANVVHQTYEKVRKEREEKQAAAKRDEFVQKKFQVPKNTSSDVHTLHQNIMTSGSKSDKKHPLNSEEDNTTKRRRCISDYINGSIKPEGKNNVTNGNKSFPGTVVFEMERASSAPGNIDNTSVMHGQTKGFIRELSHLSIQNMLIQKAKLLVHKNLEQLAPAETSKMSGKQKTSLKQKQEGDKENLTSIRQGDAPDTIDKKENPMDFMSELPDIADSPSILVDDSDGNDQLPESIDVPDPDFHDFDSDRVEKSFQSDQVWAIYDDEDGMPRYYVLIHRILSLEPFKIRVRYLNSKNNSEFGSLNWVGKGFSKTCGEFKVGGCRTFDIINMFSHRVALDSVARGVMRIVPRKGETWALYSNWSPDWDENTPDEVVYKYDMVEVLSDYSEEQGVAVSPLRKVAGFRTVFTRQSNPAAEERIPKEEMFRFSHQVPSYMLNGEEAPNSPKGCLELDPAATSVELLQVISEAKNE